MIIMLLVILLQFTVPWASLLDLLAPISVKMHSFCLNSMPKLSAYRELNAALVCSHSLYNSAFLHPIRSLGILHLFVISGYHLNVLSNFSKKLIFNRLKNNQFILPLLFFVYCLFCGLKAPILRAYFQLFIPLTRINSPLKLLIVGVLLLALNPSFWLATSLLLSWGITLIVSFTYISLVLRLILIYCSLFVFLSPGDIPHPYSILTGFLFSPLIVFVFLPLSFFSFLIPSFYNFSDAFWQKFVTLMELLSTEFPLINNPLNLNPAQKWQLLILLNLFFYYLEVHQRRKALCYS